MRGNAGFSIGYAGIALSLIALAWVVRAEDVNAIPRAGTPEHVRENAAALELRLTTADYIVDSYRGLFLQERERLGIAGADMMFASEADILAMSARRRQLYLELARS